MTDRQVLISGASVAGLSAAYWLARTGWRVTVIERADGFREGGQNVDVRGAAREVVQRMGVLDAVRAHNTTETGTVLVDGSGTVVANLEAEGPDGPTAELEILRGDLAGVLRDALPDGVEFVFGDRISSVTGGDISAVPDGDRVRVSTQRGREFHTDLLVIAEGVRSSTRELIFDAVTTRELGITFAFGTIDRTADDDTRWRWFTADAGRQVHLRPDNHGTTRALLGYAHDDTDDDLTALSRDEVLARLRERFAGAGWQTDRVLDGFATSHDLYVDRLAQIDAASWHRGHVALTGDAAWCVTPLGGGGASLALIGGYVLAAFLARDGGTEQALADYEAWMRPLVDTAQKLPPALHALAFPQSPLGVRTRNAAVKVLTSRPLRALANTAQTVSPGRADGDPPLPDMPLP